MEDACGVPRVAVGAPYVATNLTRDGECRFIVHLLNYGHEHTLDRVEVTLDLHAVSEGYKAEVISPDEPTPTLTDFAGDGGSIRLAVGPLSHYAVVLLAPVP